MVRFYGGRGSRGSCKKEMMCNTLFVWLVVTMLLQNDRAHLFSLKVITVNSLFTGPLGEMGSGLENWVTGKSDRVPDALTCTM